MPDIIVPCSGTFFGKRNKSIESQRHLKRSIFLYHRMFPNTLIGVQALPARACWERTSEVELIFVGLLCPCWWIFLTAALYPDKKTKIHRSLFLILSPLRTTGTFKFCLVVMKVCQFLFQVASGRVHPISLTAPVGEILRAVRMAENTFNAEQSK